MEVEQSTQSVHVGDRVTIRHGSTPHHAEFEVVILVDEVHLDGTIEGRAVEWRS